MSDDFEIGDELTAAQLAATVAFADAALGPSRISLYATTRPANGADPGGAPQAVIVLGKPCGTVTVDGLTLHPASPEGAMVASTGVPLWARWDRSDGKLLGDGKVVDLDPAHLGTFRIAGGTTEAGDESPTLRAGGLVVLGLLTFG